MIVMLSRKFAMQSRAHPWSNDYEKIYNTSRERQWGHLSLPQVPCHLTLCTWRPVTLTRLGPGEKISWWGETRAVMVHCTLYCAVHRLSPVDRESKSGHAREGARTLDGQLNQYQQHNSQPSPRPRAKPRAIRSNKFCDSGRYFSVSSAKRLYFLD